MSTTLSTGSASSTGGVAEYLVTIRFAIANVTTWFADPRRSHDEFVAATANALGVNNTDGHIRWVNSSFVYINTTGTNQTTPINIYDIVVAVRDSEFQTASAADQANTLTNDINNNSTNVRVAYNDLGVAQSASTNAPGANVPPPSSGGLSTGAIVGIVIGSLALVALICALIFFFMRRSNDDGYTVVM